MLQTKQFKHTVPLKDKLDLRDRNSNDIGRHEISTNDIGRMEYFYQLLEITMG